MKKNNWRENLIEEAPRKEWQDDLFRMAYEEIDKNKKPFSLFAGLQWSVAFGALALMLWGVGGNIQLQNEDLVIVQAMSDDFQNLDEIENLELIENLDLLDDLEES